MGEDEGGGIHRRASGKSEKCIPPDHARPFSAWPVVVCLQQRVLSELDTSGTGLLAKSM